PQKEISNFGLIRTMSAIELPHPGQRCGSSHRNTFRRAIREFPEPSWSDQAYSRSRPVLVASTSMSSSKRLFIHESGRPEGRPLVFFHGFPGSHKQSAFLDRYADQFDLRILSVDRPGYGYSAPIAGGLKDFLSSLARELDQRGIE